MPSWSTPALAGGAFIALYYLCVRAATSQIEDRLGALVLEAAAALGIAVSFLFGIRSAPVVTTRAGVGFSVAGGIAISFASVLMFTAMRRGGPVAATGTIVLGGGVFLSALAAPWLFGEAVTLRRMVGIGLGLAAMAVLSTE
jgi:drug/metabolite transporter (DMT)-like permease